MLQLTQTAAVPTAALVAKGDGAEIRKSRYLCMGPEGAAIWVEDPAGATIFPSMREATRAALRLPANLRAYGLPRSSELSFRAAA